MRRQIAMQVIVVENDSDLRQWLVRHLSIDGYDVVAVGSALDFTV